MNPLSVILLSDHHPPRMTSFDSLISATVGVFRAFRSCVSSWTAAEVWRAAKEDPSWAASINMAHIGKHLRRIIYTWFTPLIQDTINIFTCRKIVFWLIARCRSCTTHVACSHIGSHHTPRPRRLKTHALMHLTHLMRKVRCKLVQKLPNEPEKICMHG